MSETSAIGNKRIAKNTLFLYFRTLFVMLVSLYTSRILLEALGISDYGIYNVVGGVVTMFTFMNAALGNASSRFITFSLGKGNIKEAKKIFNASRLIHLVISILILILAETVGLWFLNTKMDIPHESMYAANWVYQFSIITTALAIISVPYNATLIAHENMKIFAYVSIFDVLLKLGIVYIIKYYGGERLILYGFLIMVVQLLDRIVYGVYCSRQYVETKFILVKDKQLYKEMFSYSGWSLIGNLAVFGSTQGLNIVLNLFFGPVINAARGIAVQVQGAVKTFISNFQLAVSPQITKSYACDDHTRVIKLLFTSCRVSFYLMFIISLPILIEINRILSIWLVEVPEYTALFVRLMIITIMIDTFERPVTTAINSTGEIKIYQISSCTCLLMTLPISYILLLRGLPPQTVFIVNIVTALIAFSIELIILKRKIKFAIMEFLSKVILKIVTVSVFSFLPIFSLYLILPDTLWSFVIIILSSIILSSFFSFKLGLTATERQIISDKAKSLYLKIRRGDTAL